jgi:hypothetical protein
VSIDISPGIALVHAGVCPACQHEGHFALFMDPPLDKFHYHGQTEFVDPPYAWCHECGQGYRIVNDDLRIAIPCNGGLHPDGTVGHR